MKLLNNIDKLFNEGEQHQDCNQLFANGEEQQTVSDIKEINITQLHEFKDHPFKVIEDESMEELKQSIADNGILMPIIVREVEENYFEILSGHRRKKACQLLELETIPCLVRTFDDEESTILMVDSNLQRETILPSEKAFAYKMKLNAIKNQGKKRNITLEQVVPKLSAREIVASTCGEQSGIQISRYIRLTELITSLLDMVDLKKLTFGVGVELSYIKSDEQEVLLEKMEELEVIPSIQQATKLKKYSSENGLTTDLIESILTETKAKPIQVTFKQDKLSQYFKEGTSKEEIENTIIELLSNWSKSN